MKKLSRTLTAGLGIAAALTLSACHPPHQQDSDLKVDTAGTFSAITPTSAAPSADAAEPTTVTSE
ncbi:hypothetical protein G7Y31_04035 [Corynebacterium lizhenjunii]|uniref:Thiamine biosynthesis protein X n=1 Tax=Corynebacterium lizhenjunii TaxID=2709394 RepID=A0A7T0PAH0_9CORY|nr:hypothetical protein [Corynebacterium lizhenjunii]QPK79873.1 hypothetical protein G7Y31_04035 [Corynebacterium lizhenjunii]